MTTFALVHGAYGSGALWAPLAGELEARGHRALAPDLPIGDRAEKIRTYNFPERRVTDHRIKLTVHNLDELLSGELAEMTDALQDAEKRQRLEDAAA